MTPEEAIEALKLEDDIEISGNPKRIATFLEAIEVAAAVLEEVQRYRKRNWIPVEERLPETSAKYLVSSDGVILYCQYSAVHKAFNVYDHFKRWQIKKTKIDADAWMPLPLPEPYRAEESDGEEGEKGRCR